MVNNRENDHVTGLKDKVLGKMTLSFDDEREPTGAVPNCANMALAILMDANLTGATLDGAMCPDCNINSGSSPCTAEQLNLV